MTSNYTGISGSAAAYRAALESGRHEKTLVIVPTGAVAEHLRADLGFFVDAPVFVMPEEEGIGELYEARDTAYYLARLRAQYALLNEENAVVISTANAAIRMIPAPDYYKARRVDINVGDIVDPADLRSELVSLGYEHVDATESHGEFSTRGGIIDIFSTLSDDPVRIEFFGDEVDSIRIYDRESQLSTENLKSVVIGSAAIYTPDRHELDEAINMMAGAEDDRIIELARSGINPHVYGELLYYFNIDKCRLWELADDQGIIIIDPAGIDESISEPGQAEVFYDIYDRDVTVFTAFNEDIPGIDGPDETIDIKCQQITPYNGRIDLLEKDLGDYLDQGYEIHIVSSSVERSDRLREHLRDGGYADRIIFETGELSYGMAVSDDKICYITERDIFPGSRKRPVRRKKRSGSEIAFSDLEKGDYVVHEEHGIGMFDGIFPMEADGERRDYLKIIYAGSDVLYIPTDQLDIIQKYIGSEGRPPALSHLSGGTWRKTRERAKKAIMEIAEDLVKLYAEREAAGGHAFSEDTVWQAEFEDDFPYTETDDQLRAIEDVKQDMERSVPMDRLICGDVGYGKTEVAARAIFKCISEGKQAVMLAPTTILVGQHYSTLSERFEKFPFVIEMLSRFKTDGEHRDIIKRLKNGTVDLVVGTHRLLSDDVSFRDLGLLVIDEEQRFGVKHKEKIKMMRKNVDVLTLSATPIPRTLNMSLTGIKNISMIEEPPEDRYPVQTFVTPEDEDLIRNVIRRELDRGGQVFVVSSRVRGINDIADRISELIPDATVSVGHGQMSESALEDVMLEFIEGRSNVLVATTIIENGIDIPNANTMIVLDADRFGLSQLYQLRGRVGRSDRIAYAYLLYNQQKVMTEQAYKRLTAIRDFTEFGAGFKLAMRDLELRGAGNLLGEAQSGHIEGIGYELYCKEINRAVDMLMGKTPEARIETSIEIDLPAYIPDEYIQSETLKLQAYKRIAHIDSKEDADDLIDEMIDRYGDVPQLTMNLVKVAEVKSHASRLGIETIRQNGQKMELRLSDKSTVDAYVLVMTKEHFDRLLTITGGRNTTISLFCGSNKVIIDMLLELLRSMKENMMEREKNDTVH